MRRLDLPGNWDQTHGITQTGSMLIPVGTHLVERDVLNIATRVAQEFPNCRVASCTCGRCLESGHQPHVVLEHTKSGKTAPVFSFTHMDHKVIERLRAIDTHSQGADTLREASENKKTKDIERRRKVRKDAEHERLEMIAAALRSHKSVYSSPLGKSDPYLTESKVFKKK